MSVDPLRQLARLYGVQTEYWDADGRLCRGRAEPLVAGLQALGAPLVGVDGAADAVRWRRQELWREPMEPVVVAGEESPPAVRLRLPAGAGEGAFRCTVALEGGERMEWAGRLADLPALGERPVEGARHVLKRLDLPSRPARGYHRLALELDGRRVESLLISAPTRAWQADESERLWGTFLPVHALHRRDSWGAGDWGDLEALIHWTAGRGGQLVAALPMLAELWELGDGPTPYDATSRLFWDELYLDLTRLEHLAECPRARALLERTRSPGRLDALRRGRLVDYTQLMRLKRDVLMALADWYFARGDRSVLEAHCRQDLLAEPFARFRAAGERQGAHWRDWPAPMRDGQIGEGDYDERVYRYHLYCQWQTEVQLRHLAARADAEGVMLCLDFPLGVNRQGFDAWRFRDLFVEGVAVGAPPDTFFSMGQNWGFAPLSPVRQRREGYRHFLAVLRRHLQYARALRLDHVMGLHRLFWIPQGMEARDGVYVRYPSRELFAILTLESHRHRALIFGENLGTVPRAVNEGLARHHIASMYVLPFELCPDEKPPLRPPPANSVASMNTHDMPLFAAYWTGADIDDLVDLGLLEAAQAEKQRADRRAGCGALASLLVEKGLLPGLDSPPRAVLEACLGLLASSDARVVLVNLEDLWGELLPQNVPGTSFERPNWRRRSRFALEDLDHLPAVVRILRAVDRCRRAGPPKGLPQ